MLNLRLFITGVALILAGVIVAVVLKLGGAWTGIGIALEVIGVVLLGVNIGLMIRQRGRSGSGH